MIFPWQYDSEGTRLRVDRSISATSTFNSVDVFHAWLAWIFFFCPGIWKAGREEDMAGLRAVPKKLCDITDTFPSSEGSASGDDERGTSSTRNSTSTLASVRSLKVRPLSQDGCLSFKKGITDSAVLVLLCNARQSLFSTILPHLQPLRNLDTTFRLWY